MFKYLEPLKKANFDDTSTVALITKAYELAAGKLYLEWDGNAPVYQVYMDGESVASVIVNNAVIDINDFYYEILNSNTGKYITYQIRSIKENAFANCESIKKVIIPDTVVNIGKNAFRECINLETVVMGENVQELATSAFSHCTNLNMIKLNLKLMVN